MGKIVGGIRRAAEMGCVIFGGTREVIERAAVLLDFALHAVKLGLRPIQLNLPVLRPAVVFTEGVRRVLQGVAEGFNFASLLVDFFIQNLIPRGKGAHGRVVFVKLAGDQLHLRTEDFKALVDVAKGIFEGFFALNANPQTKIVCDVRSPLF